MNNLPVTRSMVMTVEQLQTRIASSSFSSWLGLRVTGVFSNKVEFVVPWRNEFLGTAHRGRVHGGLLAALVDAGGGYTLMAHTGMRLSTVDLRVDYHRGCGFGNLRMEGNVVHLGRKLACVDLRVLDSGAMLLASGRGTYPNGWVASVAGETKAP